MATTAKERMRREKEKEEGSCATGSAPTTSPANQYTLACAKKKQKLEFCFDLLGALEGWYGDPTEQFSNL